MKYGARLNFLFLACVPAVVMIFLIRSFLFLGPCRDCLISCNVQFLAPALQLSPVLVFVLRQPAVDSCILLQLLGQLVPLSPRPGLFNIEDGNKPAR